MQKHNTRFDDVNGDGEEGEWGNDDLDGFIDYGDNNKKRKKS